jgi:hypothetical protein
MWVVRKASPDSKQVPCKGESSEVWLGYSALSTEQVRSAAAVWSSYLFRLSAGRLHGSPWSLLGIFAEQQRSVTLCLYVVPSNQSSHFVWRPSFMLLRQPVGGVRGESSYFSPLPICSSHFRAPGNKNEGNKQKINLKNSYYVQVHFNNILIPMTLSFSVGSS